MERVRLLVRGRVQGVGFRWYAKRCAGSCRVAGWAANLPDGSVAVVAEGEPADLEAFMAALRDGELGRNIASIERADEAARGRLRGFGIRP